MTAETHLSRKLALAFSCIGHTQMHILTALYLTVVLVLEREWRLPYDQLIGLWTVGAALIGIGAPIAGWLADRWSVSWMMVAFFGLTGAGAVVSGLADGTSGLWLGLCLLGLGGSIYHPVGLAWVVRTAEKRGQALAFNGIFGGFGIAGAAIVAGGLSDAISWRAALIIPGVVAILSGLVLMALIIARIVVDGRGDAKPQPAASRADTIRAFVLLSVTMVAAGLTFHALQTMMPKWFGEGLGDLLGEGTTGVGALVSAVYFVATFPQLLGGWLADRLPVRRLYLATFMMQVPLLLLAPFASGLSLPVLAALLVVVGNLQIPAENVLLARYTPERHRGLAFGAKFILSFGAGPVAILLVGASYGMTGTVTTLLIGLAGLAAVATGAAVFMPRDRDEAAPAMAGSIPASSAATSSAAASVGAASVGAASVAAPGAAASLAAGAD